ncbi:MAG: NAD-dependent deacylase [Planctomycetes bacterium]|nr:NAD-dependent deacylase [Planctomycetota bacterium]
MSGERLQERIRRLRTVLERADRICVLTGAGASAESGVPVYRGNEGLYSAFSAEDMATPEGFARNVERVWQWYNERREQLSRMRPNAGHEALARIERRLAERRAQDGRFTLVTQNIDGLHQAAGSRNVLELHGNIWKVRCTTCSHVDDATGRLFNGVPQCPRCGEVCRPHVVWFGEMLPQDVWAEALRAAATCEVFLSVGTSAVVQPAASLVHVASDSGATVAEINLDATPNTHWVDLSLLGPSGEILPSLLD